MDHALVAQELAALAMDEPPTEETLARTTRCIALLQALERTGKAHELIETMVACLAAAQERRVLYVYVVPHLVAAAELLGSASAVSATAIDGARFELATMLPPPPSPDVLASALSRGAKRDRRD